MKKSLKLQVDVINRQRKIKISPQRVLSSSKKILRLLSKEICQKASEGKIISISVVLIGSKKMKEINYKYRGKNYLTDVLSFSFIDETHEDEIYLGEILINPEKALIQARQYRATFWQEINRLLVHGILHLLGYDHEASPQDAKKMRQMENKILKALKS